MPVDSVWVVVGALNVCAFLWTGLMAKSVKLS